MIESIPPNNLDTLPDSLPIPLDDGACQHLVNCKLPSVSLAATSGPDIDLSMLPGLTVVFCYPRTGRPGVPLPEGWDDIPGARGCTPQSCAFRDLSHAFQALGANVFGLSTQDSHYQAEAAERLHLPFPLLSDEHLAFSQALSLPLFSVDDMTMIKRLTLVINNGTVSHVFYPVFPPDKNADDVLSWLKHHT